MTEPLSRDRSPSFDPSGRQLFFIGVRALDAVYGEIEPNLTFAAVSRPYTVRLAVEDQPETVDVGAVVRIDRDGLFDRVTPLPVPPARYGMVVGLSDGALLTARPVRPSQAPDGGGTGRGGDLYRYDAVAQRLTPLARRVTELQCLPDLSGALVRTGGRLDRIRLDQPGPAARVTVDDIEVTVDPYAEWRQIFRSAWTLQREYHWSPELGGVDWPAAYRRYRPLVDRVTTREELSDVLGELHGELSSSHTGERGGDHGATVGYGRLGIDWDCRDGHWYVGRVWRVPGTAGPAFGVEPGQRVTAVDLRPVGPGGPMELLVGRADGVVGLQLVEPDGAIRAVTTPVLADDRQLRYRGWVEDNRKLVHWLTGGRVGYVHLPDMGPRGFAEFQRCLLVEARREALLIDARFNGGGHAADLVIERLARRRVGYRLARRGATQGYPHRAAPTAQVVLINERTGSDGETFAQVFRSRGLGTVVGRRTWGGGTGIRPRHRLVDGTVTTQPEYRFVFDDTEKGLENHGCEPDVEVDVSPDDHAAGRDPQLEVAALLAAKRIDAAPTMSDFPRMLGDRITASASASIDHSAPAPEPRG